MLLGGGLYVLPGGGLYVLLGGGLLGAGSSSLSFGALVVLETTPLEVSSSASTNSVS